MEELFNQYWEENKELEKLFKDQKLRIKLIFCEAYVKGLEQGYTNSMKDLKKILNS